MDSVISWAIITIGAWYGGFRFLIMIVEADTARKERNRIEIEEQGW